MFINLIFVLSIICATFIILLVLVQDDQGEGMGGIFAGGSGSAFGSSSGNVLQQATAIFSLFFFVTALGFAFLHKKPVMDTSTDQVGSWLETEFNTTVPTLEGTSPLLEE